MINAPKYFSGFNGLRAIAVLLVLIFHGKIMFPGMYNGWIGVDLFFVISGFLITNILVKQKETTNFFSNFYLRRSIRIFPLYYIVVIAAVVILYFVKRDQLTDLSYYFFYVQNIKAASTEKYISLLAHTWSLCIEEQFYLVWPVIVFFCPLKKLIYPTIFLIISSVLIRHYYATHDYNILYQSTLLITRMDSLLIGGLIVLFVNTAENLDTVLLNRISNIVAITSILVLITIIYFLGTEQSLTGKFISGYKNFSNESLKYSFGHFKFTALALLFGSIITKIAYKTSKYSGKTSALLDHPILDSIGKVSYGIYIYHWVIFVLLDSINTKLNILPLTVVNTYLLFAVKLVLTLIVSHLSWKFIESPLNKLKDKFSYSS